LVKTTRFSVGVPKETMGLIIDIKILQWTTAPAYVLDIFKEDQYGMRHYIYFEEDLEVVSESR